MVSGALVPSRVAAGTLSMEGLAATATMECLADLSAVPSTAFPQATHSASGAPKVACQMQYQWNLRIAAQNVKAVVVAAAAAAAAAAASAASAAAAAAVAGAPTAEVAAAPAAEYQAAASAVALAVVELFAEIVIAEQVDAADMPDDTSVE